MLWTAFWQKLAQHIADTNPAFKGMTARQVFDKRVSDIVPMKREQTPEDIGWAAVFLASDEARNYHRPGAERPICFVTRPHAYGVRLACGCRAPPRIWTLLIARAIARGSRRR